MSSESKPSDNAAAAAKDNSKTEGKLRYARKVNWSPSDKPETFHTVVVNYHFGKVEEVPRNTGAIPKARTTSNQAVNAAPTHPTTANEYNDTPSLGKLFQSSMDRLIQTQSKAENTETMAHNEKITEEPDHCRIRPIIKKFESEENNDSQINSCCIRPSLKTVRTSNGIDAASFASNTKKERDTDLASNYVPGADSVERKTRADDLRDNNDRRSPVARAKEHVDVSTNIDACRMRPRFAKNFVKDIKANCLPFEQVNAPRDMQGGPPNDCCCYFCNKKLNTDRPCAAVPVRIDSGKFGLKDTTLIVLSDDEAETDDPDPKDEESSETKNVNAYNISLMDELEPNSVKNLGPRSKVYQAANVVLIQDFIRNRPQTQRTAPPSQLNQHRPKPKTVPTQTSFKQRQMELHRYRIAVEQKRLELLETKLARERDEMLREQLLFDKELELKDAQIHQFKDDQDLM